MMHTDPFSDEKPLLDEDEALDFILYQEMEKETNRRPPRGCVSGLLFFLVLPASVALLARLL